MLLETFLLRNLEQFYCMLQFQIGTQLLILPQPSTCIHLFSETTLNHLYAKLQGSCESQHQSNQYLRINAIRVFFHSLEHKHLTNNVFGFVFFFFSGQFHYELVCFQGSTQAALACLTVWNLQHMSHLKDLMTVQGSVPRSTLA